MNAHPTLLELPAAQRRHAFTPHEYRVVSLRECPTPSAMLVGDTPERIADYWRLHVPSHPYYNPHVESFVTIMVNTRRKILGHHLVATGTLDTILVHQREVFRTAIVMNAAAVVLTHNHPSGDPTPSEADIKVTRDLVRGGQLLKIDVLDHLILGQPDPNGNAKGWCSLREAGYYAV